MRTISLNRTGSNIKEKIIDAGYTVKTISQIMGVNLQAVYNWTYGKSLPTVDNLVILAHLLGVTVDDLIIVEEL